MHGHNFTNACMSSSYSCHVAPLPQPRKMIRNVTTCARFSLASGCVCDPQGEKMRELAWFVTHLKAVKGDKHAIKNFDRELECKNCCFAKAAGVEAVVPCK